MKERFQKVMEDAGEDPLSIIQGTSNRWYYKYQEAERFLLLKVHVERFQQEEDLPYDLLLDEDDWKNLSIYVTAVKVISDASDVLEGRDYPTGSSVIPFIDQIFAHLSQLIQGLPQNQRVYPSALLTSLQAGKRFHLDGYKTLSPYNVLTLLDPRYMDIYFSPDQVQQGIEDLSTDVVYDSLLIQGENEDTDNVAPAPPVGVGAHNPNAFEARRLQLLAAKQQQVADGSSATQQSSGLSFQQKLEKELNKFLSLRGSVDHKSNPLNWWRQHSTEYPLLSRYYRAHCAFPATSTNSERIYNIESLVVTSDRKKLLPGRVAGLCEARDYLLQRQQTSAFRLCKKCPQPPSPGASYIICCKKHNS